MKRVIMFLSTLQLITLFILPSFNRLLAHPDPPGLDEVFIVSGEGDDWSKVTDTDEFGRNETVELRAVLKVNGGLETYYWGYDEEDVTGVGQVYEWDWSAPARQWEQIKNEYKPTGNSNDPWEPSYPGYTNVPAHGGAELSSCTCPLTATSMIIPVQEV